MPARLFLLSSAAYLMHPTLSRESIVGDQLSEHLLSRMPSVDMGIDVSDGMVWYNSSQGSGKALEVQLHLPKAIAMTPS